MKGLSRREFMALASAPLWARERFAEKVAAQGMSPMAFALTADGAYAYIGFDICERVLRVKMEDLSVDGVADLSQYFPMESEGLVLDERTGKLFVFDTCRLRLVVVATATMEVVDIIPNAGSNSMFLSRWRSAILAPFNWTVTSIDTETHRVTRFTDDRVDFLRIRESSAGSGLWHVATQDGPHGPWVVGLYDSATKQWQKRFLVPIADYWEGLFDFFVVPNGTCAFLATMGGWFENYRAFGWVHRVDLETGIEKTTYVEGGAFCLECDASGDRLFVGRGWPAGGQNDILCFDTRTGDPAGQIAVGRTKYGWQCTQMNRLRRNPSRPEMIHATTSDGNAFLEVDTVAMELRRSLVLNNEDYAPHRLVRRTGTNSAYILFVRSPFAIEINLDTAEMSGAVRMPVYQIGARTFDVGFPGDGRLLIAQGDSILEADAGSLKEIARHRLPKGAPGFWDFSLSRDGKRLYSVTYARGASNPVSDFFSVYDTSGFEMLAGFSLEGGSFSFRPWETPDGSKLFISGGMQNGAILVHVVEASTFKLTRTMRFEEKDLIGIVAGPGSPYAYDELSRLLFVGATNVVLVIDINSESITRVIRLSEVAPANGLQPYQLTYINAVGLVHHAATNRLYIAHSDGSFVSVYDLEVGRFLPQLLPLRGYGPNGLFDSSDQSKLYTINSRTNDISVIDREAGNVARLIDLSSAGAGSY